MPADPITLTVWRDAVTDPPVCEARGYRDPVLAQLSHVEAAPAWWDNREFSAWDDDDTYHPTRWARFPAPPSEDALTLDHLRVLREAAEYVLKEHPVDTEPDLLAEAAARLRRAIEQAEGKDT